MLYPAIFTKENTGYSVTFRDIPTKIDTIAKSLAALNKQLILTLA